MGTSYHVTLVAHSEKLQNQEKFQQEINDILKDINQKMSTYQSDSEISTFNSNSTLDWVPVSEDFYHVVKSALTVSQLSKGFFDITISPLIELWGFGTKEKNSSPKSDEVKQVMSKIGFEQLALQESPYAFKKAIPNLKIDLSSIAKGYAVDRVSDYLSKQGIDDHLVEIGGEVKAQGKNFSGNKWRIAIESPDIESRKLNSLLELDNKAVATSGDYRNYYVEDGVRLSHIINPKTGYPIKHKLASVTVVHDSTMLADAWATALMVLGEIDGKSVVLDQGLSVQMIIRSNGEFITWKNKMP